MVDLESKNFHCQKRSRIFVIKKEIEKGGGVIKAEFMTQMQALERVFQFANADT